LYCSGILVKELAAKAGIKKHTIDNYLSVRGRMPAADVAVRMARVLGVTVEYLVTGSEISESPYSVHLSPEIRKMARLAEQLTPDHRKIALSLISSLKKHQESVDLYSE